MAIVNMNIFKPSYICASKIHVSKFCFALSTNNASNASLLINKSCNENVIRRSGNYKPPTWEFDCIQSLKIEYKEERYSKRAFELKKKVTMILDEQVELLDQLEMVDNLQRLGISYHFENEIKQIMSTVNTEIKDQNDQDSKIKDLYTTALGFRLLRQHGVSVSQDIFDRFKNEKGEFETRHCDDIKGLLQLYEASFLAMEGEKTLEMATDFARKKLNDRVLSTDEYHSLLVRHALELPLHWTVPRAEARWYTDFYRGNPNMNPILLEFAQLDFNIVQAKYQQELKQVSRWWKGTSLAEKLPFARDRLVESFFWTIGVRFEPEHENLRRIVAKLNAMITVIDDIYDVYGTLEELEIFTRIIERWDVNSIHQLPDYMQLSYLALYNLINEFAYDVLKEKGLIIIPYLRKAWTDLCQAYLHEAKWYFSGYKPTLEEYMNTAWISVASKLILSHTFFIGANPIEKEATHYLDNFPSLISLSATLVRLADDLGTSSGEMERGDVPKSIQCYMNETGASEEESREHIKFLIVETWKKFNSLREENCQFSKNFVESAADMGRMAQYMYQFGDGHGLQNQVTKGRILALLFEPIPLE